MTGPGGDASGLPRIAAWLVDWLIISGYAVALIPLGLLVGGSVRLSTAGWNLTAFVVLILPVTVWLAAWEHYKTATPGKRLLRLRVATDGSGNAPGLGRAFGRNLAKVALPWEVGHTGVFFFQAGDDRLGTVFTVLAWLLAGWYAVSLFVRRGRTPYDAALGTIVRRRAPVSPPP